MKIKKTANPLAGLQQVGRNQNLNVAYEPPWDQTQAMQMASAAGPTQGDTRFDPFMGTQWGRFIDTLPADGIRQPGRGKGDPLAGLRTAVPAPINPDTIDSISGVGMPSVNNPFAAPQRTRPKTPLALEAESHYRNKYPGVD